MAETTSSVSRESILFGIIGLLLGIVLTLLFARTVVNNNMTDMMRMMGMHPKTETVEARLENRQDMHDMGMGSSMDDMMQSLKGKTGDEFDKAFISSMIVHHQGAIDMAKEAQKSAKHDEIKNLANDIITAQTREIEMMRNWQKFWGF